ncbi:TEL2, telomere maintenance protein 2 [Quaeritorhiza haematococci]|nr:TEL2, telomere maintenance protein 2 [Quaeritorhiza haematococci]
MTPIIDSILTCFAELSSKLCRLGHADILAETWYRSKTPAAAVDVWRLRSAVVRGMGVVEMGKVVGALMRFFEREVKGRSVVTPTKHRNLLHSVPATHKASPSKIRALARWLDRFIGGSDGDGKHNAAHQNQSSKTSSSLSPSQRYLFEHKLLLNEVHGLSALKVLVHFLSLRKDFSMVDILKRLVEWWTDATFMRNATMEQFEYISKSILLFLNYIPREKLRNEGVSMLFVGRFSGYLDSNARQMRTVAMIVAECFSKASDATSNLDFGIGPTEETKGLRELARYMRSAEEEEEKEEKEDADLFGDTGDDGSTRTCGSGTERQRPGGNVDEDDDEEEDPDAVVGIGGHTGFDSGTGDEDNESDDGLQPYDMQDEEENEEVDSKTFDGSKRARPFRYVRECLQALRGAGGGDNDQPEKIERALAAMSGLIDKAAMMEIEELSEQIAMTLLHIRNTYELKDFEKYRAKGMKSLLLRVPIGVSRVLIDQFYQKNLSLGQRLDILTFLGSAAWEMSSIPEKSTTEVKSSGTPSSLHHSLASTLKISSPESASPKTRTKQKALSDMSERIVVGTTTRVSRRLAAQMSSSPSPGSASGKEVGKARSTSASASSKKNAFAPVARHMFFPLLGRFDRPSNAYNMLGKDDTTALLESFIRTLAIILHCSVNTIDCRRMTREYFNFIWSLRFLFATTPAALPPSSPSLSPTLSPSPSPHISSPASGAATVRGALLFGVSVVLTVLPSSIFWDEFGSGGAGARGGDELLDLQEWLFDTLSSETLPENVKLCTMNLKILHELREEFQDRFYGPLLEQ